MSRRTLSLLACALGLLAGAASPAAAQPIVTGGCGFTTTQDRLHHPYDHRGTFYGEMDLAMTLVSSDGEPLTATVTCYLVSPDGEVPGSRLVASGTGLIAGARTVTYESRWVSPSIEYCEEIDYAGAETDSKVCSARISICFIDCMALELLGPTILEACETAGEAATDLGVARVEEDGDVYVEGAVEFSCWPFDDGA